MKRIPFFKILSVMCITFATLIVVTLHMSMSIYATEVGPDDLYTGDDDGPATYTVTLYESYNATYQLYEESMDDKFFIFCSTGNGSITPGPVLFDIPANVAFALELDGAPVEYANKTLISNEGNYVMRFSADYNGDIYEATFRFSIKAAPEGTQDVTGITDVPDDSELSPEDLEIDPNDDITDEDIDRLISESGAEFAGEAGSNVYSGEDVNGHTGYRQDFMADTGMYNFTLKSGEIITSNIPAGAIVNSGVAISVPSTVTTVIYKDGSPYENDSLNFTESGFYTVWFEAASVNFNRYFPEEGDYPFITFRIVSNGTSDIEVFNAPEGCKIIAISDKDDNAIRDENGNASFALDYYWMREEGVYKYTVMDMATGSTYQVRIDRDLTSPVFYISGKDSKVNVSYGCNDVARAELYRNNQPVAFDGSTIEGKGNYTLVVTDYAGNTTTANFTLKDAFNVGTFLTVLLLVIAAGAAFIFIRLHRTVMRIR